MFERFTDRAHKVMALANQGTASAVASDPARAHGVNVVDGQVVLGEVAEAHGMTAVGLQEVRL